MIAGYDPEAVNRLEGMARRALDALRRTTSADPEAAGAMRAIVQLRRALNDEMLPALATLSAQNPLGRAIAWSAELEGSIALPAWESTATRWSGADNDALLEAVREMSPAHRTPDRPYGGLTHEQFDDLVKEFTHRAAVDPDFARSMIDELGTPILGDIVLAGTFSDEVIVGVLDGLLASAPSYGKEQVYRSAAIEQLLVAIMRRPGLALDIVGDIELLTMLLTFNDDTVAVPVSPSVIADFLLTAMVVAPELRPERRAQAVSVLASLVEVAQDDVFNFGFPAPISQAMAIIAGVHIDAFVGAAHHDCVIDLLGAGDRPLGSRDEVLQFFGAMVYDPTSRVILAGVLADAARRAAQRTAPFDVVDVSAMSVLIGEAVNGENVQLDHVHDRTIAFFRFGFDFVGGGVAKVTKSIGGGGTLASFLTGFGLGKIEDAVVGPQQPPTTGAPNFAQIGDLVIRMQIIAHAVGDPSARRAGATAADVRDAQRLVDETTARFSDPEATYADVQRAVTRLEVDLTSVLGDGVIDERFAHARYLPRETHDATDVCANEFPS